MWQSLEDWDPDTSTSTFAGVRTFVVTGAPILTTADVVEATPATSEQTGFPEVYVAGPIVLQSVSEVPLDF